MKKNDASILLRLNSDLKSTLETSAENQGISVQLLLRKLIEKHLKDKQNVLDL